MSNLAPIALFVYNRPLHVEKVLNALSGNFLADQSRLFIFADGPKKNASKEHLENIKNVRKVIRKKKWCSEVHIIEREENTGIGNSIIAGVTDLLKGNEKIIVLEDDIVVVPSFLKYMNDSLALYGNEDGVMHISGYTLPLKSKLPETFFYHSAFCWGWGTWSRAWRFFSDDSMSLLNSIKMKNRMDEFSLNNTNVEAQLLIQNADIESASMSKELIRKSIKWNWDVCWSAAIFIQNGLCLHPRTSLVENIGFDGSGNHFSKKKSPFQVKVKSNVEIRVAPIRLEFSSKALDATKLFFRKLNVPSLWQRISEKARLIWNQYV